MLGLRELKVCLIDNSFNFPALPRRLVPQLKSPKPNQVQVEKLKHFEVHKTFFYKKHSPLFLNAKARRSFKDSNHGEQARDK